MFYQQVKLKKGSREQVSWVPDNFAKKGKVLKLKEGDTWENGWEVTWVFRDITLSHAEVMIENVQHKHHREVTDI